MEEELFFTGYCRCLDDSRMVTAEWEDGAWEIDCQFGNCPYEPVCQIAEKLQAMPKE